VSFLHDACLALEQAGVSTEGTHLPGERELLLDRFHRQLALLGAEYQESGRTRRSSSSTVWTTLIASCGQRGRSWPTCPGPTRFPPVCFWC
jgi:hypothetical protein